MSNYKLPPGRGPMGPVDDPNPPRPGSAGRTDGTGATPSSGGLGVGKAGGVTGVTYSGDGFKVGAGRMQGGGMGVGAKVKFAKGGKVKKMAKGGSTASKRADGCAVKGKTKGRFV